MYVFVRNNGTNTIDPDGRAALAGVISWIAADLGIPEPTDLALPKWAGYAALIALAAAADAVIEAVCEVKCTYTHQNDGPGGTMCFYSCSDGSVVSYVSGSFNCDSEIDKDDPRVPDWDDL